MEPNPLLSAFATAFCLVLAMPGCAASLQPTDPHVPVASEAPENEAPPASRPPLPAVIVARAFGERRGAGDTPTVANVPFLAPDTSRAGPEPCRLVALPEEPVPASPPAALAGDRGTDDAPPSGVLAAGGALAGSTSTNGRAQPPTITVTGFRGRAPVDIAWAFPVPPARSGGPPPAAPTGKTLVQMALFDAMPSQGAKPQRVLQCTSEIDSIAWAVPRAMVDTLLGTDIPPSAVVRVSVARAPGKLAEMPTRTSGPRFAVGAFVDLPVARDASLSRR